MVILYTKRCDVLMLVGVCKAGNAAMSGAGTLPGACTGGTLHHRSSLRSQKFTNDGANDSPRQGGAYGVLRSGFYGVCKLLTNIFFFAARARLKKKHVTQSQRSKRRGLSYEYRALMSQDGRELVHQCGS